MLRVRKGRAPLAPLMGNYHKVPPKTATPRPSRRTTSGRSRTGRCPLCPPGNKDDPTDRTHLTRTHGYIMTTTKKVRQSERLHMRNIEEQRVTRYAKDFEKENPHKFITSMVLALQNLLERRLTKSAKQSIATHTAVDLMLEEARQRRNKVLEGRVCTVRTHRTTLRRSLLDMDDDWENSSELSEKTAQRTTFASESLREKSTSSYGKSLESFITPPVAEPGGGLAFTEVESKNQLELSVKVDSENQSHSTFEEVSIAGTLRRSSSDSENR